MDDRISSAKAAQTARAREFWSAKYGREVSSAELEEIDRNLTGFFNLLLKWKREEAEKAKNAVDFGRHNEVTHEGEYSYGTEQEGGNLRAGIDKGAGGTGLLNRVPVQAPERLRPQP